MANFHPFKVLAGGAAGDSLVNLDQVDVAKADGPERLSFNMRGGRQLTVEGKFEDFLAAHGPKDHKLSKIAKT